MRRGLLVVICPSIHLDELCAFVYGVTTWKIGTNKISCCFVYHQTLGTGVNKTVIVG